MILLEKVSDKSKDLEVNIGKTACAKFKGFVWICQN